MKKENREQDCYFLSESVMVDNSLVVLEPLMTFFC